MDQHPGNPSSTLRPLRIGELMDASIKLYLQNWKTVIAFTAVIVVPVAALQAVFLRDFATLDPSVVPSPEEFGSFFAAIGVSLLVQVLTTPLLTGGLSWLAAKLYLGENPTAQQALSFAFSKFGILFLVGVLTFIASFVGFIFLIIPGILIYLRLVFSAIAVVVEGNGTTGSLKRSWNLSKGSKGKIFLALLVSAILVAIFQGIVGIPFGFLGGVVGGAAGSVLIFIGDALSRTIATPFAMIVIVLLYFDTRVRKEGFDLALMAQEIGPTK